VLYKDLPKLIFRKIYFKGEFSVTSRFTWTWASDVIQEKKTLCAVKHLTSAEKTYP